MTQHPIDLAQVRQRQQDVRVAAPGRAAMVMNMTIVPPLYVLTAVDPAGGDGTVIATGPEAAAPLIQKLLNDAKDHTECARPATTP